MTETMTRNYYKSSDYWITPRPKKEKVKVIIRKREGMYLSKFLVTYECVCGHRVNENLKQCPFCDRVNMDWIGKRFGVPDPTIE